MGTEIQDQLQNIELTFTFGPKTAMQIFAVSMAGNLAAFGLIGYVARKKAQKPSETEAV